MNQNKVFQILYKNPTLGNITKYIFVYIFVAGLIILLPIFIIPTMQIPFYFIYLTIFLVSLSLLFIIYVYWHGYWYDITKFYLEHVPKEINFNKNKNYAGVVIADKNLRFGKYLHIYNGGALLLIEHLRNRNIPVKIVRKTDKQSFLDLVYDEKCTELYIFGHGRRYRLTLHKNKFIEYNTLSDAPKKKRIEQLHCNHKHEKGKSLTELLGAEEKYKNLKMRSIEEVINIGLHELLFED